MSKQTQLVTYGAVQGSGGVLAWARSAEGKTLYTGSQRDLRAALAALKAAASRRKWVLYTYAGFAS